MAVGFHLRAAGATLTPVPTVGPSGAAVAQREMQKCLTDNVVTANEQGCPELEEQSAEANSHWEFTDVDTEPAEPRLRSGDSS